MLELFESDQADNPVEALRRAVRPVRRRRFYKTVAIAAGENGHGESGYAVHLDGKPARTPGRRLLAAPGRLAATVTVKTRGARGEPVVTRIRLG